MTYRRPPVHDAPGGSLRQAVDNPWLVVMLLFFVTLLLGIPLLWVSRGFSLTMKVVLTLATLVWTALVLWAFFLIMAWCYHRIFPAGIVA